MKTWRIMTMAGVTSAALMLTACGGGAADDGGELEKTELKVGSVPIADYAALNWADEKGFFEDEGLDVTIETVQGGPAGVQKVVAGELDFTNSPAFVAVMAVESGLPIRSVVLTSALAEKGMGIYVREDSPIKEMKDLDGKNVGTNTTNNIGDITFRAQAAADGVKVAPNWVEVPFPEMVSGVKAKSIDAGYLPEPFQSFGRAEGLREVVDLTHGPNEDLAAASFLSSVNFVKENPTTSAAFARAMYAAGGDMAAKEDEVREWLPSFTSLDEKTAQKMPLPNYYSKMDDEDYQRPVDILKSQELIADDMEIADVHWTAKD